MPPRSDGGSVLQSRRVRLARARLSDGRRCNQGHAVLAEAPDLRGEGSAIAPANGNCAADAQSTWRQVPLGTGARPDHPHSARAVQGHRVVLSPGPAPRLRPDREIICLIKGRLRDLRNEHLIEREHEEGRRRTIADPDWKPRVADMSLAMRDGDRLYTVALNPTPVHLKGFALMYC